MAGTSPAMTNKTGASPVPFTRPRASDTLRAGPPAQESPMSAPARKVVHSDIKPENPPHLASRYLGVPNMPWQPTKFPGIEIKVLYSDDSGITTALFKLAP